MTDVIRKQILIELIDILENPRKKIQLNEFDIPFSSEEEESSKAALDTAFSNAAEEFRYLFDIVYRKQTGVGRFQSQVEQLLSQMWNASLKMTWEDIKLLAEKNPAVLFALVFDTASLVEPTGVSDIISGAINLAYAVSHGDYILGPILSIIQIGFGFIQAGLFIGTAGADAPLVSLIKLIVKGGWRLLNNPEVWIVIVKFLRQIKDSIIEFFSKTKIGKRFFVNLEEIFENLFSIKPKNIPTTQPPKTIISDVTKNQLEMSIKNLKPVTTPVASTPEVKNIIKAIALSGVQGTGYRLGIGGTELMLLQNKIEELQEKTEKYMRNVWCKLSLDTDEVCSHIETLPSYDIKYTEKTAKIEPKDDEPISQRQSLSKADAEKITGIYKSLWNKKFEELALQDPKFLSLASRLKAK